jgi:hypothetical protein
MEYEKPIPSSTKLTYCRDNWHSESLTRVRVTNGNGFKTVVGDVMLNSGGKYYFVVRIIRGTLIKIGISKLQSNSEVVSAPLFNSLRLSATAHRVGLFIMESYVMAATHLELSMAIL